MKKLLVFSLMIALLFSLAACDLEQAQGERLGVAYYNAHNGAIAAAAAVVDADGKIIAAYLDDLFFRNMEQGYEGLPSATDATFIGNLKNANDTLASKMNPVNSAIYGAAMAKSGSTVLPADNLSKIKDFAAGKTIAELEKYMSMDKEAAKADIQAASGATFADNQNYLKTIVMAAKNAQKSKDVFNVADPANVVIGQAYYYSHGGGPTNAYVVVEGDVIVKSYVDDINFFAEETNTIIELNESTANSFAGKLAEGKENMRLGSKKFNLDADGNGIYGTRMPNGAFNSQIAKVEAFVDGKTVDEVVAAANEILGGAATADVVSGSTMADTKNYLKALAIAAKPGYAINDTRAANVKVADIASFGMAYSADTKKISSDPGLITSTVVAAAFDADGKVVKAVIDVVQPKIASDFYQPSKNELGYDYKMAVFNPAAVAEWHVQAMAFTEWWEGQTVAEITGMPTAYRDESHTRVPDVADLATTVTVDIGTYIDLLQKAYDNAKAVDASAVMDPKVGLALSTDVNENQHAVYMQAVLLDGDAILGSIIDIAQQDYKKDDDGNYVATQLKSKKELGPDYNMATFNPAALAEWDVQATNFEEWMTGKTVQDIQAFEFTEDTTSYEDRYSYYSTDADLASHITVGLRYFSVDKQEFKAGIYDNLLKAFKYAF